MTPPYKTDAHFQASPEMHQAQYPELDAPVVPEHTPEYTPPSIGRRTAIGLVTGLVAALAVGRLSSHEQAQNPTSPVTLENIPSTTPDGQPSTQQPPASPSETFPSTQEMPLLGTFKMPAAGPPPNPGDAVVFSPNKSPIVSAEQLKGPRIRITKNDDPQKKLNETSLEPGTVIELERGASWGGSGRIIINGNGTKEQPILICSVGDPNLPAPIFSTTDKGSEHSKDDGVFRVKGSNIHVRDIAVEKSASIAFRVEATDCVFHNCEAREVVIGYWVGGDKEGQDATGCQIWNSYVHDLDMMFDTPKNNDDYGATAVVVSAHNVHIEGLTARNCIGDSPDYNQYGGDGSMCDVWIKGDNLRILHSYADRTPRVLEAGGLGGGNSAKNMRVEGIFANVVKDDPFYFNPDGPYAGVDTSGFVGRDHPDNVIVKVDS